MKVGTWMKVGNLSVGAHFLTLYQVRVGSGRVILAVSTDVNLHVCKRSPRTHWVQPKAPQPVIDVCSIKINGSLWVGILRCWRPIGLIVAHQVVAFVSSTTCLPWAIHLVPKREVFNRIQSPKSHWNGMESTHCRKLSQKHTAISKN